MSRIVLDFSAKPPYMIFEWPSLGGHSRSGRDCVLNDLVKYKEEREKWKKRERGGRFLFMASQYHHADFHEYSTQRRRRCRVGSLFASGIHRSVGWMDGGRAQKVM